jgi:hypothetical protein
LSLSTRLLASVVRIPWFDRPYFPQQQTPQFAPAYTCTTVTMLFHIGDLPVLFPYPSIYPEQFAYMSDLKKTLDVGFAA